RGMEAPVIADAAARSIGDELTCRLTVGLKRSRDAGQEETGMGEETATSVFDTISVSARTDLDRPVPESRAIQKKETPKRPAIRVDLKRYAAQGPLAASLLVAAVLGSVAVLDKVSRRRSIPPRTSVTRPLGTGTIDRPPARVKRVEKHLRVSHPVR